MRDQYAGDISDLLKLALLRQLARDDRTIGVGWYYNAGHDGRNDGRHREYCDEPKWASLDEAAWSALKNLPEQSVAALERLSIWPAKTRFHRVPVARAGDRRGWAENMRKILQGSDLVFLDPDNGVGPATERNTTVAEVAAMRRAGRAVVLIKFPGRQQKHSEQVEDYHKLLHEGAGTRSVVTVRTSVWLNQPRVRWFTIIDADGALIARAEEFARLLNGVERCGADVVSGQCDAVPPPSSALPLTSRSELDRAPKLTGQEVAGSANAYVLRLGDSGPAGLSQEEALIRLFRAAADGSALWFAVGVGNPGQLRMLASRLIDHRWWLCASWNGSVRFVGRAARVIVADDPQPVPSDGAQKAWTKDGQVARSRCWVELDPGSFLQVGWARTDIMTWQGGAWRPGFPKNQTALLRAIVPV